MKKITLLALAFLMIGCSPSGTRDAAVEMKEFVDESRSIDKEIEELRAGNEELKKSIVEKEEVLRQLKEDGISEEASDQGVFSKCDGLFCTQFHFITDQSFFSDWEKPTAGVHIPSVDEVKKNVPIFPTIIFAGTGKDDDGNANIVFDFEILDPKGDEYSAEEGVKCWVGLPAPNGKKLQLCKDFFGMVVEDKDLYGEYKVKIKIKDQILDKTIELERSFLVVE